MYQVIDCILESEKRKAFDLVQSNGLSVDQDITETIMILDEDQNCIATGSIYQNVIKMIAVAKNHQGENLTAVIISELILRLNQKGIYKYFIYTTKENKIFFINLNFKVIIETNDVVLLENNINTITETLNHLKKQLPKMEGTIGAIVMNCNPITLGHRYLIEKVSKLEDHVIIFLVMENRSVFPYEIREKLVKESVKDLKNVYVLPSTTYIISQMTFPTYFLKELSLKSKIHMTLDISIFKTYFFPIFNITHRYTGSEPLDPMTDSYNETMRDILKEKWIMIPRLQIKNTFVSASLVRRLASEKKFDELKSYVPDATYQFLISKEGLKLFYHE